MGSYEMKTKSVDNFILVVERERRKKVVPSK